MRVILLSLYIAIAIHVVCSTKIPSDVLDLSDRFLDAMDNGFWFVKFYAPWCVHCKRLAPIWEGVGHVLADYDIKIRVGKVDCTRFPIVASKLGVTGYPTLIFFRNGVRIPYEGERKKDSLVDFAKKTAGPVITDITTKEQFAQLRKTAAKDPYFVYIDGNDDAVFNEFDTVSSKLFTSTRFFRVKDREVLTSDIALDSEPDVLLFKSDKPKSFKLAADETDLNGWIHRERWSLIPFVSASNVYSISEDTQKKLVLAVIDLVDRFNLSTESGRFFQVVEKAAIAAEEDKTLRSLFQFGWLDGNSMANSVVMGQMNVPGVFVFNVSSYEFYLFDDSHAEMTPLSVVTGLNSIAKGDVAVMGGRSWAQRIRRMGYEITTNVYEMFYQQPILTLCLFGEMVREASDKIIAEIDRDEIFDDDEYSDEDNSYGNDNTSEMEDHEKAD